jgi:protein-L-isoaspartate O-methyltransferase
MNLQNKIVAQFRRPTGLFGRLAGWFMASRAEGRKRSSASVDLLDPQPGDRVLEIGYGPGLAVAEIGRRLATGCVYGLDHSEEMHRMASRRCADLIARGVADLRVGGLDAVASLPGPFDRILSINVVLFWEDKEGALRILRDSLAPGGRIATTYQPRHPGATAADATRMGERIEAIYTRLGLKNVRTETIDLKPVPAICTLGERA